MPLGCPCARRSSRASHCASGALRPAPCLVQRSLESGVGRHCQCVVQVGLAGQGPPKSASSTAPDGGKGIRQPPAGEGGRPPTRAGGGVAAGTGLVRREVAGSHDAPAASGPRKVFGHDGSAPEAGSVQSQYGYRHAGHVALQLRLEAEQEVAVPAQEAQLARPCPKFTLGAPGAMAFWIIQCIAMFSSQRLYCCAAVRRIDDIGLHQYTCFDKVLPLDIGRENLAFLRILICSWKVQFRSDVRDAFGTRGLRNETCRWWATCLCD